MPGLGEGLTAIEIGMSDIKVRFYASLLVLPCCAVWGREYGGLREIQHRHLVDLLRNGLFGVFDTTSISFVYFLLWLVSQNHRARSEYRISVD